jgi:hypothetical protein
MGNGLVTGSAWPNGKSQPTSSKKNPSASYRAGDEGLTKSELAHAPGWDADEHGQKNSVKEQSKVTQKDGKIKNSAFSRVKY